MWWYEIYFFDFVYRIPFRNATRQEAIRLLAFTAQHDSVRTPPIHHQLLRQDLLLHLPRSSQHQTEPGHPHWHGVIPIHCIYLFVRSTSVGLHAEFKIGNLLSN